MMTPLETRVSLNALPSQGPVAFQEQAGMVYRQLQEQKETQIQAKTRDSRIDELKEKSQSAFHAIENPGDDSPRKQELFDRERERQNKEQDEKKLYHPQATLNHNKKYTTDKIGVYLDLTG